MSFLRGARLSLDVVFATSADFPDLIVDDQAVLIECERRGVRASAAVWDSTFHWADASLCVMRSVWDYDRRPAEFASWLRRASRLTRLANPRDIIEWNMHKRYLIDLKGRGVPVIPTILVPQDSIVDLDALIAAMGWADAVIKPAIGATSRGAILRSRIEGKKSDARVREILRAGDALVQEFQGSVIVDGELSCIFIDGAFSHAVRKRPRPDEWRVQSDFGGSVEPETPREIELVVAERAINAVESNLLFARVDMLGGSEGQPLVVELELIEPELFFASSPPASGRFVKAIQRRLRTGQRDTPPILGRRAETSIGEPTD
jgi:glutathione synthase/RimK-type ligase-like ATP-grasp enzyme